MIKTETWEKISGSELDGLLERVRDQGWTSLALVSRRVTDSDEFLQLIPAGCTYIVDGLPRSAVRLISRLTQLSSLWLVDLRIGAEGARALASLTGLTSLTLDYNGIGDAWRSVEAWTMSSTRTERACLTLCGSCWRESDWILGDRRPL